METPKVVIIDYGLGNVGSLRNMLKVLGVHAIVSAACEELTAATHLILPGVGHFDRGMKNIRDRGLEELLNEVVLEKGTPALGICLGMQLMARRSEEGCEPGLGWLPYTFRLFDAAASNLKLPNMGWNWVDYRPDSLLFRGLGGRPRFYFVHSYRLTGDDEAVSAWTEYGTRYGVAYERQNIFAVQFHPEKSHRFGLRVLKNFLAVNPSVEACSHAVQLG